SQHYAAHLYSPSFPTRRSSDLFYTWRVVQRNTASRRTGAPMYHKTHQIGLPLTARLANLRVMFESQSSCFLKIREAPAYETYHAVGSLFIRCVPKHHSRSNLQHCTRASL